MPELPGFAKKRKILFSNKTSKDELIRVGRAFAAELRFEDAIEFFARASATEEIEKIAETAREMADVSLYMRSMRVLKRPLAPEICVELAEKALAAGRPSMALVAYREAGMEDKVEEMRAKMVSLGLAAEPAPSKRTP